jgi:hypothetical protein
MSNYQKITDQILAQMETVGAGEQVCHATL